MKSRFCHLFLEVESIGYACVSKNHIIFKNDVVLVVVVVENAVVVCL
jgi:hypothetical protein